MSQRRSADLGSVFCLLDHNEYVCMDRGDLQHCYSETLCEYGPRLSVAGWLKSGWKSLFIKGHTAEGEGVLHFLAWPLCLCVGGFVQDLSASSSV